MPLLLVFSTAIHQHRLSFVQYVDKTKDPAGYAFYLSLELPVLIHVSVPDVFSFRALQCLNNVRAHVIFHCLFNFFEGFVVNGVINVIIVALETRYKLSSTKSGLIASGNDFGAFPILLFVDLHVEGRSKPHCMAAAVLVMLLGSLFLVLPC